MRKHKETQYRVWVILHMIKFCSIFLLEFYGLDNVDLQSNYAIERMKWVVLETV